MQNPNIRPSDRASLQAAINPQSASAALSTGWVSLADSESALALVSVGALSGGFVDAKIEQASNSSGAGVKDVTGKSVTRMSTDNKQAQINVRSDDLDVANSFTHIRLTITPSSSQAGYVTGALFALDSRYQPLSAGASVAQTV